MITHIRIISNIKNNLRFDELSTVALGGSLRPISLCWSSFKLDHGSIQYSGQALELSRNVHACGYLSIEISR